MKTHLLKLAITFYSIVLLACPSSLKAQLGSVLNFDGANDYVSFGTPATWWNLGSNFTIEMWVNPNHTGNQILLYGGHGCITCPQWELSIGPEVTCGYGGTNTRINFSTIMGGRVESDGALPIGVWTHVAITYDGDIMKMYVNGILQTTTPGAYTRIKGSVGNPSYMYLGMDPGCSGRYPYSGSIDEFRVWNTVRTQYEIQTYMVCEIPSPAANLVANFHFNQGLAGLPNGGVNTLIDDAGSPSGNLNNFTLNGGTSNWITPGPFLNGNVLAIPPVVEINVKGNSNTIADSDLTPSTADYTNFNGVLTRTFVIENLSALGTLNTGVYFTGPNAADFSVAVQPAPTIAGIGTASFVVTFLTGGTKTATVNIGSNDLDEPVYKFAVTANAPVASAFRFDGIDDGLIIPNLLRYDFTIEYWMRTDQQLPGVPWQWYGGIGLVDGEAGGIQDDFGTALCHGGVWGFGVGNSDVSIFSTTPVNTGKWVHVAATRQSGTGQMKLYVNGVLEATGVGNGSYRTPSVLSIGRMLTGVSFYKGEIDNLRLWTTVRTQCELQQYMNCEIPANSPGLVGNYQFSQGTPAGNNTTVTTVYDVSTRESHGYVEGSAALTGTTSNWVSPGAMAIDFTTPSSSVAVLNITGNSNPIVNGAGSASLSNFTDFSAQSTRSFVVQNTGTGPLNINAVTFTGTAQGEFSVVSFPTAPLATGNSGTVVIAFTPTVGGLKNAIVKVASTDCSIPQYSFEIAASLPASEALQFDGSGDLVNCGTDPSLDITTGTWETWVNLNALNTHRFFFKELADATHGGMYEIFYTTGYFYAELKIGSVNHSIHSITSPVTNTWYHVAATYDGTAFKLYVNGVLEAVTFAASGPMNPGTGPLSLGASVLNPTTAQLNGSLDETRLWSVPRTQCEIQSYMNCEITSPMSGLVLSYNFNEGIPNTANPLFTVVPNMASSVNTGTLVSFALTGSVSNWIVPGAVAAGYTTNAVVTASADVQGNGNTISHGDTSPSAGDFTDFGAATTRSFVIRNTGSGTLTVGSITLSGANAGQFSVSLQPAGSLTATAASNFAIAFTPTASGTSTAYVMIPTNDCLNPTYSFVIQAQAPAADAIGLDGSNDRIERAVLTNNTSNVTLQAKIYWRGAAAGPSQMVLYNGNSSLNGFGILKVNNDALEVFYGGQGGQPFNYTLTPNQWVSLTAVLKNGVVECYVNGVLTNVANMGTPGVPTGSFTIGSNIIGTETFNGLVDEVLVWDKALTQCEIQSILNCEIAGAAPNLLANYHFNQGAAGLNNAGVTTVLDASGNNNHMTLQFNSLFGNFENWLSPGGVVAGFTTTSAPLSSFSVTGNGNPVAFGSTVPGTTNGTDFGISNSGTFTLYNAGSGTLNIGAAYFTGPNAGQFSVTAAPASSITSNTTSLTIILTPTNAGISTATVNIPSNDCTHPTYSFVISASVTPASALNFDGGSNYVFTPTLMALAITNSATIEGWFRTTSSNFQELFGMLDATSGNGFEAQMSGGKFGFNANFGGFWVNYLWSAGPSLNDGNWHHFAVVLAGNTAKGYIDGNLAGTTAGSGPVVTGPVQAAIGVHPMMLGYFDGDIDNIRSWNTSRLQCEIQSYMSAEIPSTAPGLVLNYKFNQGIPSGSNTAVTTLTDAASGISATLNNFSLNGPNSNWISPGAIANDFTITAPPTASIVVSGDGNAVTHSATATSTLNFTDFGSAATHSFVITNVNTGTLSIDLPYITGLNAGEFSISAMPASTLLSSNATTTFEIAFTPTAGGIRSATVNIPSNDCSKPLFWYTIQGQAPLAEAIHFDNVDDHITVTPGHNLNGQSFTIEFYAKRNSNSTVDFVFGHGTVGTNTGLHLGFYDIGNGNQFIFGFWNNDLPINSTDLLPHHWACVYDATVASGPNRFIYIDGKLANSDRSAPYTGSGPSFIGSTPWAIGGDDFDGSIDELRVWNTARTQCEIQSYMNCEIPTTAAGLVSNYHFNQGSPNLNNSTETVLLDAAGSYTGALNLFALNGATSNWVSPGFVVSDFTTAVPPTASISVTGGGNAVLVAPSPAAVLNHTDFQSTASQTFVIQNSNTGTLNIGMPYLSGINAGEFSITTLPASTLLSASATTSLVIAFTPTAGGVRNATVNIYSNDCGKPLFSFNISGSSPVASALDFDGNSDYVSVPDNAAMHFGTSTDITMEAVVQFTANHSAFHGLISKGSSGAGMWPGCQLIIVQNKLAAEISSSSGAIGLGQGLWGSTNLNDGQWHHVAMVISRSSNTARLYVDGILEASVTDPVIGMDLTTVDPLHIGTERNTVGFLQGKMDEVRIWNVARSQCEIQSYMRCEIPGSAAGLLANYHLNQGSPNLDNSLENILLDAAGTYTGTLNSFALNGAASNWSSPGAIVPGFTTTSAPSASIGVSGNGNAVAVLPAPTATLNHTDFQPSDTHTFVIQNVNTGTLTLGTPYLTGPHTGEFSITVLPGTSSLTASGTTSFVVVFTPTAGGTRSATLNIASNDCGKPLFSFNISGSSPVASALDFDGIDDHIALPLNANIPSGNSPYTLEARIKPDIHGNSGIIGWGNYVFTNQSNVLRLGFVSGTPVIYNYWYNNDLMVTVPNLADGNWHHLAATYDGTSRKIYVDGTLIGFDVPGALSVPNNVTMRIGSSCPGCGGEFFDGKIDEVRVWNLARTECELRTFKDCEIPATAPGLVLNYHFNQGSPNLDNTAVNTATDASSNALNGTLTNMALTGTVSNWVSPGSMANGYSVSAPPTESISVSGNSNVILNNASAPLLSDHTDFGSATTRTFVIQNANSGSLTIGQLLLSGAHSAEFSITVMPTPTLLTASGTASFVVSFSPTSGGIRSASVQIANNDCNKPLFSFAIQGSAPLASALDLDGTDDFVQVTHSPSLMPSSALTVEFWVKPKSFAAAQYLVSKGISDQANGQYGIYLASGVPFFNIYESGFHDVNTGTSLPLNAWSHVAGTWDGTRMKIYVNGQLINESAFAASPLTFNTGDLQIGRLGQPGFMYYSDCVMDELRIWNIARTQCEIQSFMDCEIPSAATGLVANYHFNQGAHNLNNASELVLNDAAGTHNGALNNFQLTGTASNWVSPGAVANNYTTSTAPSAAISLSGNSNPILNHAAPQVITHTDFGSVGTRTFVIQNSSSGTLNISMPVISGPNAAEFSLALAPSPTLLPASGTASYVIAFTPTAGGIRSASISIGSNDCTNPLMTFAIQGNAPVASAIDFDGADDILLLPASAAIPVGNSPYTMEARIKPDVHATNGIIGWGLFGSGNNNLCNALRLGPGNTIHNYWWANDLIVTGPNLADGNWHHLAATFDGSVRSIYIDGQLSGFDFPTGHAVPNSSNFTIGNTCGGACSTPEYFDGAIDEVRVWNMARTQCEIQTYKDCEIPGSMPGLVLNYHFNQGGANLDNTAVNTATDASSSAITATLTNLNLTGPGSNWISPGSVVNGYTITNAPTASISLSGNSNAIANNSAPLLSNHTDFGSAANTRTFVIQNSNSGTLNIGAIYLTGPNSSEFSITVLPTSTLLSASGTTSFEVVFTPTASGVRSASISILSNDCSKPVMSFGIQGTPLTAAALNFDGVDDYIDLPSTGLPTGNSDFTVEFWVKPKSAQVFHRWVAWYGAVSSGSMVSFGYDGNNGNKIRVHHFGPDLMATTASVTLNAWTHVAINYRGAINSHEIFINGNYVETLNFGVPLDIQPNPVFQLGTFNSLSTYCADMDLDEFRVWNRALCAPEIQNNMNCEIATTAPGLIYNYHFNQGSANVDNSAVATATDAAGAFTGTLTGFALAGAASNWINPGAVNSGSSCTVYLDPEIALSGNATPINDGDLTPSLSDDTDFGGVCINTSVVRTFSIQNTGTSPLSVSSITMSGADAASFSVGLLSPAAPVSVGGTATFAVTFTPSSTGVKNATIHISNGDCDENLYDVAFTGTCHALPVVGANTSSAVICNGFTTSLSGSGANTYTWTSGGPAITDGAAFSPSVTLTYTVNGTDALTGCTSTNNAMQTITVYPIPTVAATSASMSICAGGSTTLTAAGADTYTWNPGALTGSNVTVSPASTEVYTLSGTYNTGACTNTNLATITITVNALPTVTASTPNASICAGAQATLIGTGADTYTWNPGSISGTTVNPSPTANSTYSLVGTSTAGCISTNNATVAIGINPLPVVFITPANTVVCAGASASLIAGGADTYTWNPGGISGTTLTPSPGNTTDYTLTGTSLAGCTSTNLAVQMVTVYPIPTVAATSVSMSICIGGSTTLTATGADTYTWNPGTLTGSNVVVSPAATEVYTLNGTYNAGACTNTNLATITITVNALPTVTASTPNASICAGSQATLVGTGANTYTWNPGGISGTTVNPTPAANTTYSLVGTSTAGCISTNNATVAIGLNPLPVVAITPANTVICAGASASLIAGGADTYTWNPGGIVATTITPSPASSTNYTLTGTSLTGCTSTNLAIQMVTVYPIPTVAATSVSTSICIGGSTTLTATGADTYTWNPGILTGSNVIVSPSSTEVYTLTGTYNAGACTSTNLATITITVNALPTVTASTPNATICAAAQATLIGTGANTYTWNPGGTTGATVNPVLSASTTYSLVGTSTAGCISTNNATVVITVNPLPTVAITPASTVICAGASASLIAGGADTYTWNPGGSNATTITPSPAATIGYTLTGTSLAGCTSTNLAVQSVSVNALPTVTAGTSNSLICTTGTTSLIGSGADTYTWLPGNIPDSSPISPTSTTSYSLSGSYTLSGCSSTNLAVQTISVIPSPTLALSTVSTTICAGGSPTLTAGNADTYTWNPGNFTTTVISPTLTSNTVFTLTGSSAAGCPGVNSPTQAITVNALPAVTASASTASVCAGYSTSLHGDGAVNYSWTGGIVNAQSFTPAATGDYTVTGTDANNCQNTATITVTVNPIPSVTTNITSTVVCAGTSITLSGNGADTYTWTNGISDGVAFAPAITATYNLSGSSLAGCTSTNAAAVQVTVNASPSLTVIASNTVICSGNTVTLAGSGAQTYTWTDGISDNTAFSPTTTASYTLTGTDINNCENFTVTTVTVNTLPVLVVSSSNSVSCEAETVTLSVSGAASYTWSTAETGSVIVATPTVSSTYTIEALSAEGCTNTAIYTQSISPCDGTLTASFASKDVSCNGKDNGMIDITASHTYSNAQVQYLWNPAIACPDNSCDSVGSLKAGTYSVMVKVTYTLNNILVRSDSMMVGPIVISDLNGPCLVKVHNGVTPNGDGINDRMHIENIEEYPLNKVWVYNRWGQLVYEIQGYDNEAKAWPVPGEVGKLMPNTYFYVIDLGDGSKVMKGWVELFKE